MTLSLFEKFPCFVFKIEKWYHKVWPISTQGRDSSMEQLSLDDWIEHEALPFSIDSPTSFNAAVDKLIASLGDSVELLGFGEALHGGKDILILRNRLFQRLVEAHGYWSWPCILRGYPGHWI
jgi:hypothetical protein